MFSATHEIAASAPNYAARSKQPHSAPAPSDGFASLIDSAAPASRDTRGVPQPAQPQRTDTAARDTDRHDAPNTTKSDSTQTPPAPKDAKDSSLADNKGTDQAAQSDKTAATNQGPAKGDGTGKVSPDGKKGDEQTKDGETDASTPIPSAAAVDPNAVAVVVPVATDSASPSTDDANAAPLAIDAIAGTPATTAPQGTEKNDPSAAIDAFVSDTSVSADTATSSTDPKSTAASASDVTKLSTPEAAEVATAAIPTATTAQQAQGAGKVKATETSAKTAASGKDGDKQVIESSTAPASPERATESAHEKTTVDAAAAGSEKPVPDKTGADKTDTEQDTAAASSDGKDSSKASMASHTPAATEHRLSTAAPAVQPLQPDPSVLLANNQPQQPLQLSVPNVAAMPAPQLTATVLAGDAPVPLDGLAADIALRAAGGNSRFEIRLDPAELGRIDVRLDVDKHGQVTSHLTVERPATLDMLRRDAPQLQQALEDAGLKTGDGGLQFSLRDQSSSGQQNDNGSGRQSRRLVIAEENTVPVPAAGRNYGRMLGSSGGVDIRV